MKIGVFDSGVGGLSIARALETAYPEHEIVFRYDKEHFPYSSRPPTEIYNFVVPILNELYRANCRIIVIACNTVSTTIIDRLRHHFPALSLIAVEPMIKPAATLTKSGVITVCATPTTLTSARYHDLKQLYARGLKVLEPDCSYWSYMIETNQIDRLDIRTKIEAALDQQSDVVVLGCTHFHWIEQEIKEITGSRAVVIQPEQAIVDRVRQVLAQLE